MVPNLLMLGSGLGLVAATAALWVQRRRRENRRVFAGLISMSVTSTLFLGVAWARPRSLRSHLCLLLGFLSPPWLSCSL